MGLFDLFKSKDKQTAPPTTTRTVQKDSLTNFNSYYLYGLTDEPFRQSNDFQSLAALYNKVVGKKGGIAIGSSFHPYQLVNPSGITAWQAAYILLHLNEKKDEAFNAIINDNGVFMIDPSDGFKDIRVWPDTRLTTDENPVFGNYVPFVIPFLVYKSNEQPSWDIEIASGMATKGHATEYVEQVNGLIRFMMPVPAFILGFDEFDDANPSGLIDKFINCKKLLGQ